jgi:hypothetical protein
MGFNSAFKELKLLKNPWNGRLNNVNDSVLNVLRFILKGYKAFRHKYIDEMNRQILRKKLAEISALTT